MKRSELKRYAETTREWQARSRRPLRPVSPAKRRWLHEYLEARETVRARAEGRCEAALDGCTGAGTECHHAKGRVGPDANYVGHLYWLCANCHRATHRSPKASYASGLMVRRTATSSPAGSESSDTLATNPSTPPTGPAGAIRKEGAA